MPDTRPRHHGAHLRALLAMACWGQMIPIYALLLHVYDPLTLSVLRYAIGVPCILVLAVLWRALLPLPGRTDVIRLALLSWFGMTGLVVLSTVGLALSDPVTAIFVSAAAPLIHTLIAVLAYGERMLPGSPLALGIASLGMVLITLEGGRGLAGPGFRGGEFLLLGASACWAWYSLQAQRWFPAQSSVRLTAYSMVLSLPCLVVVWLGGLELGFAHLPQNALTGSSLALLVWVVFTGTCVGVTLWNGAVSVLGGTVTAIYLALAPLFGLVIGLFFGFVPGPLQLAGGGLIIIAVLRTVLTTAEGHRASRTR